ncbi:MAG: hypothetical protein DRP56_07015 [Planctomycetota bacterium]|nr:MAG: hypothetical protein DRP56_07015 [Planctomycetota bacterium]
MKAIYRNKTSGDIFAIETDEGGKVIATCGPLFADGFDPKNLDYDEYWNTEIQTKLADFEKITENDYLELLKKNGFITDSNQRHLF